MDGEAAGVSEPTADFAPLLASDALPVRKSCEWAKRKLHFLRNYCGVTTVAMRKKWHLQVFGCHGRIGTLQNKGKKRRVRRFTVCRAKKILSLRVRCSNA
jgi:hypothetical protein